ELDSTYLRVVTNSSPAQLGRREPKESASSAASPAPDPAETIDQDLSACLQMVRSIANTKGSAEAEKTLKNVITSYPLSTEALYLQAMLMIDLNQPKSAIKALRHVLYLDRSLAEAHYTLGIVLKQVGDIDQAKKSFQSALQSSSDHKPDEPVPLGDGDTYGRLARSCQNELSALANLRS
ncbi:MAG TPA: tetratricopeptide repeat protein, partial [Chroococcales cyanobacterium]